MLNGLDIERTPPGIRIRKEETNLYHADDMDARNDCGLLHRHVLWAYLCNWHRYRDPDHLIQGSHCHCQCPESRKEPSLYEVA